MVEGQSSSSVGFFRPVRHTEGMCQLTHLEATASACCCGPMLSASSDSSLNPCAKEMLCGVLEEIVGITCVRY